MVISTKTEIILYVADQERSKIFYQSLLEANPVTDVPGMTEFQLNANCKLGLMPESGIAKILTPKLPHPSSGNGVPRCELYLTINNVEAHFLRCQQLNLMIVDRLSARDWGDNAFYISDPDGHVIVFAEKFQS